ncbi:hypothetical protein MVES_000332 [Malassezia vespertilionis]|uniref:Uncharacterized protein n=1 Tax=Malassezia vespertilionis TaxID=2020962 RepID=A0A2N1JFZ9_9BASI|nr:hypothetical protein MVES_000332 [Malassezia vespertilionis]
MAGSVARLAVRSYMPLVWRAPMPLYAHVRHTLPTPSIARYTTETAQPEKPKTKPPRGTITIKGGILFLALSSLAIALTVYGVWEYMAAFRIWPKELRGPLRAAIKARNRGKLQRSAKHFREALDIARKIDPDRLGADPVLKTSGIAIALAAVLEESGQWQKATLIYIDALDEVLQRGNFVQQTPRERTPQERMRSVALAQKIGDLAQGPGGETSPRFDGASVTKLEHPAEGYLVWSVEELLRLLQIQQHHTNEKGPLFLSELQLPGWINTTDIGASVEALGAFYAGHDMAEYAVPLYLQALSILLPVKEQKPAGNERATPTVADRCRAAILMNNISQVLAQGKVPALPKDAPEPKMPPLEQAIAWATKGMDLVTITSHRAGFLQELPEDERNWLLHFSGFDPAKIEPPAGEVHVLNEERLVQVKHQCLGAQFVLLYNLGIYCSWPFPARNALC